MIQSLPFAFPTSSLSAVTRESRKAPPQLPALIAGQQYHPLPAIGGEWWPCSCGHSSCASAVLRPPSARCCLLLAPQHKVSGAHTKCPITSATQKQPSWLPARLSHHLRQCFKGYKQALNPNAKVLQNSPQAGDDLCYRRCFPEHPLPRHLSALAHRESRVTFW